MPQNASFWQVGLLDVVLSDPDKSHNFTNLIFMTSHSRTLLFDSQTYVIQVHIDTYCTTKCETFRFSLPVRNLFTWEYRKVEHDLSLARNESSVRYGCQSLEIHYSAWFLHFYTSPSMLRPLSSEQKLQ